MKFTKMYDGSVYFKGRVPFTRWRFCGAFPSWIWCPSRGEFGPVTFYRR